MKKGKKTKKTVKKSKIAKYTDDISNKSMYQTTPLHIKLQNNLAYDSCANTEYVQ